MRLVKKINRLVFRYPEANSSLPPIPLARALASSCIPWRGFENWALQYSTVQYLPTDVR